MSQLPKNLAIYDDSNKCLSENILIVSADTYNICVLCTAVLVIAFDGRIVQW